MISLAYKNLVQEKTRLLISVGGVAFSVLLMILLQGLSVGYSNVLGQYFETVPADLWVAKADTGNIMDPSFLPLSTGSKLQAIDGVADVQPFGMQSLTTNWQDKQLAFYIISVDPTSNTGKPSSVSNGKQIPGTGEIIIDRITAKANKIKLGDTIQFSKKDLKVVGLSEGTYLLSSAFAFVNKADARQMYSLPDMTNYYLVQLQPGADLGQVQTAINTVVPGVYAHTRDHFIKVNVDIVKSIVKPVFGALVVLGALIGTVVIGLTIFTSTVEKSREYGVLKAIGFKNRQLFAIVIQQAVITALIGYVVGAVLAILLQKPLGDAVPQFLTQIRAIDLAWIFAVTITMAIVSAYVPMRRLSTIDPAEVFRS